MEKMQEGRRENSVCIRSQQYNRCGRKIILSKVRSIVTVKKQSTKLQTIFFFRFHSQ